MAQRERRDAPDLGAALLDKLATVDPASMDVARFLCLCRCRHRANYADRGAMPICVSGREFQRGAYTGTSPA
jgi:hypothetical protein